MIPSNKKVIIIPSADLVTKLLKNLSAATTAIFQPEELIAESVMAIAYRDPVNIPISGNTIRADLLRRLPADDNMTADLVSKSWFEFTEQLFERYARYGIWDHEGFNEFYFHGLTGNDIVLKRPDPDPGQVRL